MDTEDERGNDAAAGGGDGAPSAVGVLFRPWTHSLTINMDHWPRNKE